MSEVVPGAVFSALSGMSVSVSIPVAASTRRGVSSVAVGASNARLERIRRDAALREAADLFVRQYGAATRAQLVACGLTQRQIDRRLAMATMDCLARSVYTLPGFPDTWERRAVAAVLVTSGRTHPGALSHASAAAAWGLPGFARSGMITVLADREDRHPNPLAIMARCSDLEPGDVVRGPLGVATTSLVRTVIDLAVGTSRQSAVEVLADAVVADGRIGLDEIAERLARMAGKPGVAVARRVLHRRLRAEIRALSRAVAHGTVAGIAPLVAVA